MELQEFLYIYFYLDHNEHELSEMISHPEHFTPEQIEWKRTSNNLFEAMVACHFPLDRKSHSEAEEWE